MRKTRFRLMLAAIAAMSAFAASGPGFAADQAPVVCVFNMEIRGVKIDADMADRLTDYISTRMAEGGRYQVVPREQMKAALSARKTESRTNECYSQSCQIELGQELAASKTLAVAAMKLGSKCKVSLSLYDLRRSTTENAATASGACTEDGIVAALDEAFARLVGIPSDASTQTVDALQANYDAKTTHPSGDKGTSSTVSRKLFNLLVKDFEQDGTREKAERIENGYGELCASGDAFACNSSVWHHPDGPSLSDLGRAFEAPCKKGEQIACTVVAWSLSQKAHDRGQPWSAAENPARAAALYRTACESGVAHACRKLGELYEQGAGVTKSESKALTLYRKACDGKDGLGCSDLGQMYRYGFAIDKDEEMAVDLFRSACDADTAAACVYLALMYGNGEGVVQNIAQATSLFDKACDAGRGEGCTYLGMCYARGVGVEQDNAYALRLSQDGCDLGDQEGCTHVTKLKKGLMP